MTAKNPAEMVEHAEYWKEKGDAHGYVLQGAPWGSGARPFATLFNLGMLEDHDVLDYGCGSLRVGRFLIQYLDSGRYFGIEPSTWAVSEGLDEVGSLAGDKAPQFLNPQYDVFDAGLFGEQRFDWVLISGVLTHMDHTQLRSLLRSAQAVLKPGGRIVGSYLPQGPDHTGEGWLYPQQAAHYRSCIRAALPPELRFTDITVPGDPAMWFDAWFEAYRA